MLFRSEKRAAKNNESLQSQSFIIEDLPQLVCLINSNDTLKIQIGVINIRRLLSTHTSSQIQEVIDSGACERLVELLDINKFIPSIIFEVAWCLTNIAMGTFYQINSLISKGAIPKLISLINTEFHYLKEQVILYNIRQSGH